MRLKKIEYIVALTALAVCGFFLIPAYAEYGRIADTELDPSLMEIDEKKYLGSQVNVDFDLTDGEGNQFKLGDMLEKPLILVLSYYSCEGVCYTTNNQLIDLISDMDKFTPGDDYRLLTISFDKFDDPNMLARFEERVGIPDRFKDSWKLAVMKSEEDIKALVDSVGYKFFWSRRDRTFLHPNVYIILSPSGRISRYLYASTIETKDIELALLDADRNKTGKSNITKITNLALLACYSYNYKEGKYTLNYPLFIGAGSLFLGSSLVFGSLVIVKRRKNKEVK